MNVKNKNRVTMNISWETKELLDLIKHTGQSYDGLIRELVASWEEKKEVEATK